MRKNLNKLGRGLLDDAAVGAVVGVVVAADGTLDGAKVAIATPPSGPMLLLKRFKEVSTPLTASALPIATPPSGPMWL